jgi:hypothetical protein
MTDQEIDDLINFARFVLDSAGRGLIVSSAIIQRKAEELGLLKEDVKYYELADFLKE